MTRRFHLVFDIVGQVLLLAAFIYLLVGFTQNQATLLINWRFFALFTTLWQLANATISSRVYENPLRRGYLRFVGWALVWVIVILGLLFFLTAALLSAGTMSMDWLLSIGQIVYYIYMGLHWAAPAVFTGFIGWYYYLTAKDVNIIINKTI